MDKAPQFFHSDPHIFMPENPFIIEDLLDFPDGYPEAEMAIVDTSTASSTTNNNSCNSSFSAADDGRAQEVPAGHSTTEFFVPYEDLAELEWVSNFVEGESFSSEDLRKLQLIQGIKARTIEPHQHQSQPEIARASPMPRQEVSVPAKAARSKRSRTNPSNWTSRLLVVPAKTVDDSSYEFEGSERRCVHCATDKTPQWRTGPTGPKTLCNACGVRYKSGRLVAEYRPGSSPTFVMTKHSNSHRKVVELRRQKEMVKAQQQQQQQQQFMNHENMMFDEDLLIDSSTYGFRHR